VAADDVRARELARQKRETLQRFMKDEQARRLEESRRAHELQKAEDERLAQIAREKALKDELFRAKKASDDSTRQLVQQQVVRRVMDVVNELVELMIVMLPSHSHVPAHIPEHVLELVPGHFSITACPGRRR